MSITVSEGNRIDVVTTRLRARFEGPRLIELRDPDGNVLLAAPTGEAAVPAIEVFFQDNQAMPVGAGPHARIRTQRVSDVCAHVFIEDDEADAFLRIAVDPEGRLLVEPAAQALRPSLGLVRWSLAGIADGLQLVAPFFQGARLELEHPLAVGYWAWPSGWEAALAILQGASGGFSVRTEDRLQTPKALRVGNDRNARTLGFDTEAHGPWDRNQAVGSLTWILDTHEGGWEVPVDSYRRWLFAEYRLDRVASLRPDWVGDVRLAIQWCPCKEEILTALAKATDARTVLLHVPGWRADAYDENYPEYNPSDTGRAFITAALGMGFRAMPHFNYFAMDPNHPLFARMRDFLARDVRSKRLMGWRWKSGTCPPFPQAVGTLGAHRDEKVMAYVHPGASAWRRELVARIAAAARELDAPGVFVDQTLCTYNLDNAQVENLSMPEGMAALTRELTDLRTPAGAPLAVGGEGRHELSMQYQSVAQVHLYRSWHRNADRFAELDPVPVCERLFGSLCRSMGYTDLGGDTPDNQLRLQVHEKLGAIPSLTLRSAEQITSPNAFVKQLLSQE